MNQQRGFTLAELLVSLSVAALLVSLVYGSLRIGVRSWEAADTRSNVADTTRIGWLFLHRALADARPVGDPLASRGTPIFNGRPDRLRFAADMPSHLNLGGLYVVEIARNEEKQLQLSRTLMAEYRQARLENRPQSAVLADNLQSITFKYFGKLDREVDARWHTEWKNQLGLPALIRIDVEQQDGSHWPTLIAHPRIGSVQHAPAPEQSLDAAL